MKPNKFFHILLLISLIGLASCSSDSNNPTQPDSTQPDSTQSDSTQSGPIYQPLQHNQSALYFLNQASFGATQTDTRELQKIGFEYWIEQQFAIPPPALATSHDYFIDHRPDNLILEQTSHLLLTIQIAEASRPDRDYWNQWNYPEYFIKRGETRLTC